MASKSKEQIAKERAVSTHRDISQVFKTNLISDFNRALAQGTVKLENENENGRFLSLLETLIDLHLANSHEQFVSANR